MAVRIPFEKINFVCRGLPSHCQSALRLIRGSVKTKMDMLAEKCIVIGCKLYSNGE